MTTAPTNNLAMPSKVVMVEETIARFDVVGVRSQLLSLDAQTLRELGLMLTDKAVTILDAWRWLDKELGGTPEAPAVSDKAVYRLAEHFRRIYSQVRREQAQRVARLTLDHATAGNLDAMKRVAQHRLVELAAEQLVAVDGLEELRPSDITSIIATISAVDAGKVRAQELELKVAEDQRKQQKLEDDLKTSEARRAEIKQTLMGLHERIKALETQLAKAERARVAGKKIDPSVYTSIRQELLAMAAEAQNGGTQ